MEQADELLQQQRMQAGETASKATGTPEYKSAADFDARLTGMLMEDEAKERQRQEQKIERQKIAQSMTDLGAVFGDVIKASGGALVTPRDVKAKYDALDKNTQTVYDNYRTRMEAMRKGLQDRTKGDMDAAEKAKDKAAAEKLQRDLLAQKQAEAAETRRWRTEENRRNREARIRAAQMQITSRANQVKDYTEYKFTLNDAQGTPKSVNWNKAEAKMYIPDTFRWMVYNNYIDLNDDAYPKTKKWNSEILGDEYEPTEPTKIPINKMYALMEHAMFYMDNETSAKVLKRMQEKKVQIDSGGKPQTATTGTAAAATPAATTTTTGKKVIAGFGGN